MASCRDSYETEEQDGQTHDEPKLRRAAAEALDGSLLASLAGSTSSRAFLGWGMAVVHESPCEDAFVVRFTCASALMLYDSKMCSSIV